ncbi:hypothetical protein FEM48_Zijuj10G0023500 [Ziziphus jujuba var. spinosa]|uniref:AAA+ ATPase domain-containing protein n=1 Tax=Ziziphus jujuba var. spinosa TaxID=714518 RepID=A0A978UKQ8_ZIZJJ|nr:hypothetical protein FEM48_Zijuj10G0023500 [Ziziphus jujuba var. spinosa]
MIFTTKYRERLDPALLRPGRMDMHICLSYSNASVFDQLAFNYLGLDHHRLFHEIKRLIEEIEVTPAEVGGELMKSRDPQVSLQGPPGTGKTSLIAAMSSHLKFDIYNLDFTDIQGNSQLRYMPLSIYNKSIVVVEDIDCSMKLQNQDSFEDQTPNEGKGLLNFVDGLHSCCGESRIIIFTMNYKGLDQALLRAGRVDTHICLSFCNAPIFAQLASTIWGFTVIICLMTLKDDKRDRGESSKSGWRVDEEQDRSSSLFKAL